MAADMLAQAEELLASVGVRAPVSLAGHARDVLVVHASPSALANVHAVSSRLRALGYRYVTLDITADDA